MREYKITFDSVYVVHGEFEKNKEAEWQRRRRACTFIALNLKLAKKTSRVL